MVINYNAIAEGGIYLTSLSGPNQKRFSGKPDDFADKSILALVSINGKNFGFINRLGEWVIHPEYDYSSQYFYEGLAFVGIGKVKTAVIDPDGNIVIPPRKIEGGVKFSEGLAWVRIDGKGWYIDRQGNRLFSTGEGRGFAFRDGLTTIQFLNQYDKNEFSYGFINKNGDYITKQLYNGAGPFSEGLAWVSLDGKHGYINQLGEIEIELRFDDAKTFSEGLAPVMFNNKWGYINRQKELAIEPRFDYAWPFYNGLACIKKGIRCGFINHAGDVVVSPLFKSLDLSTHTFTDKLFPVVFRDSKGLRKQYCQVLDGHEWKNGSYGYIDRDGNIAILPRFKGANNFFFELADVRTDKKYGYINRKGVSVIGEKYIHAGWFHDVYASWYLLF